MDYKYFICDVFTTQRFSGNPLAVFPNAEGLSDLEMQKIAREFNFSETTSSNPLMILDVNTKAIIPIDNPAIDSKLA